MRDSDAFEPCRHSGRFAIGVDGYKFWTRSKFKGCTALKRKVNSTRMPIEEKESYRWLENLRQSKQKNRGGKPQIGSPISSPCFAS